jgi:hypothetical protein
MTINNQNMKKTSTWLSSFLIIAAASLVLNSCKKKFDEPAGPADPDLTATHTIKQLRALHTVFGAFDVINTDIIIQGVVVANDKSGNLYKEIYIQDGTAGINVLLDANGLYNSYPVGRKVFIKCNGLCLSDYNRLPQLGVKATVGGVPSIQAIASNLIGNYIAGGSLNNPVTPKVVTVSQLTTSMSDDNLGTLVQLNKYEFIPADTSKTFADTSAYKNSVNLNVRGCAGGTQIIIRSSGYANFAGKNVPNGNGTLYAIYTLFGNTKQLIIRDESDVQFNNFRCGQGPTTVMNISDLRALYTGTTTAAPDGRRITGVVISDRTTNNINSQNLVLQQGDNLSGILVRFDAPHSFNLGDSIDVNVSQQELSTFNGLLQVNQVPLSYAALRATGKTINPRVATIAQINTNFATWESTLVQVNNFVLSGGATYSGSLTMNDGATIILFTSSAASFAGQTAPANVASLKGYLTIFGTTKEISIRNPATDVVAAGGGGSTLNLTTSPYLQNFNGIGGGSLPAGVFVKVGATSTSIGSADAALYNGLAATDWTQTSAGVKNFASATGLTSAANSATQAASTDRALGFRQTGTATTGGDPGVAFSFQLANTLSKTNFQLSFLLQQLDPTSAPTPRVTTWAVQYGLGANPSSFTTMATSPALLTTTFGTWVSTPVTVNFGAALNNLNQPVWIRIVALNATTGSGSRPSTALDNFQLSWN